MTREEALETLIDNAENGYVDIEEVKLVFAEFEQEPCKDAISRESVLKLFATHDGNYLYEAIRELPSVQPKRKTDWIPVSDRLPETNDDVIVYDGVDMFVAWRWITCRNQEWDSRDDAFDRDTPIIAWIPLPEPPEPYNAETRTESEGSKDMTLAEKILDFIEENYPTEVINDWEKGCAYALDEIEKICKAESEG